jgi:hypothetical protein
LKKKITDELRARGFIPEDEAAAYINNKPATLRYWRVVGRGPRYYKTTPITYRIPDLDAHIESLARKSTSDTGAAS